MNACKYCDRHHDHSGDFCDERCEARFRCREGEPQTTIHDLPAAPLIQALTAHAKHLGEITKQLCAISGQYTPWAAIAGAALSLGLLVAQLLFSIAVDVRRIATKMEAPVP